MPDGPEARTRTCRRSPCLPLILNFKCRFWILSYVTVYYHMLCNSLPPSLPLLPHARSTSFLLSSPRPHCADTYLHTFTHIYIHAEYTHIFAPGRRGRGQKPMSGCRGHVETNMWTLSAIKGRTQRQQISERLFFVGVGCERPLPMIAAAHDGDDVCAHGSGGTPWLYLSADQGLAH